ncbi:sulfotransferase domain-containing protein [Paraglaciecola arctica]|uniref:Sulfotransferase n=1 Tax=Paraglaciecola arctica BSs20135 TaxID=493475 RepID=K6YQG5_9ALTE|nr:sulfotransferase domain-containing protein [Paraglaciecola arctica]GAC18853.1 sulfotransferase [Paraglaciecola arctica BSs20135]
MSFLPQKIRDIQNHHLDSTIWDEFEFRDDDIIIATYAKSGTTWMQQIVSQLIFNGEEGLPVSEMSPWVDLRIPPKEVKLPIIEQQTHRRFLKTHLPIDALVFSEKAKYIYVVRDGRDVVWSLYNHHTNANNVWYDALNNTPGRVGPEIGQPDSDPLVYFENWLVNDGAPFWSYWENVRTWWEARNLPNVMLMHFADLKADIEGQIRKIADFLDIQINEDTIGDIVKHCSFDYMKAHADQSAPLGGAFWDGGAKTFIHKGLNGRWKKDMPKHLSEQYEQAALSQLGSGCSTWLKTGSL